MKFTKSVLSVFVAVLAIVAASIVTAAPAQAVGTAYYVNNATGSGCSDSSAGTITTPWCTFTPANAHTFGAGDQLLLARGDTWNQQLTLNGSGTAASHAVLSSYGSGANPKILRDGTASEMAVDAENPSYWDYSNLELGDAGIGLRVYYTTLTHAGLSFSNIYVHDNTGWTFSTSNPQCLSTNREFVPAGIAITGDLPAFSSTDYAVDGVNFSNITGTRNVDSISVDMCNGAASSASGIGWTYNPTALTTDGKDDYTLIRDVVMRGLNFSDDDGPGSGGCPDALRITDAENVTVMDSSLNDEAACHAALGTAAVIMQRTHNVRFVNDILENTPNTSSTDQTAIDFEKHNTNNEVDHDYIAGNAGPGIEVLAAASTDDQQSALTFQSNLFANNGTASSSYTGSIFEAGNLITPTVTIQGNLYNEPSGGLFDTGSSSSTSGFTFAHNNVVQNQTNAAASFSSTQGSGNWSYEYSTDSGSTWSNLTWDASLNLWDTGSASPAVSQFDQLPSACSSCLVSRTWTAPSTGTVSIRADALATQSGGDGVSIAVQKNSTALVTASTVTTSAEDPISLDAVSVATGDKIRFEVGAGSGNNSNDLTSFDPSIGFTAIPSTPTGVVLATAGSNVTVSWPASTFASSYSVLRSTTPTGTFASIATITSPSYTYQPGTTVYYYKISASNDTGTSALSALAETDLAAGATVTASSTYTGSRWALANVADGTVHSTSADTGWTSNNTLTASHTEWVQLDLGTTQPLSRVTLYPVDNGVPIGSDFPIDYTIQISADGTTWSTVATVTGAARPTAPVAYGFATATARYIKVTGTKLNFTASDNNSYRMQFAEIGVFALPETDLAAGSTVTASSTYTGSGWALGNVADGTVHSTSADAGWTSNNSLTVSHTEWVQLDMGFSQSITGVTLYPVDNSTPIGSDFPIDYTIQTSPDGTTWTTVATVTGAARPTGPVPYTFTATQARYVKVTGTKLNFTASDNNSYRMQFAEIGAFS